MVKSHIPVKKPSKKQIFTFDLSNATQDHEKLSEQPLYEQEIDEIYAKKRQKMSEIQRLQRKQEEAELSDLTEYLDKKYSAIVPGGIVTDYEQELIAVRESNTKREQELQTALKNAKPFVHLHNHEHQYAQQMDQIFYASQQKREQVWQIEKYEMVFDLELKALYAFLARNNPEKVAKILLDYRTKNSPDIGVMQNAMMAFTPLVMQKQFAEVVDQSSKLTKGIRGGLGIKVSKVGGYEEAVEQLEKITDKYKESLLLNARGKGF